jgi:serine/threonine protein kinase/Tol biopolymer transport system component
MPAAVSDASIGPYNTLRQLGAGAMGEVFLAHDSELGRNIAIKLLPPHLAADEEQLARLRREARTTSSLNHPNIVTIYEIGQHGKSAFIAMEYIDGSTLRELLSAGALPLRKALQIAAQIADGLAAAHKRDLVHRDLKPENVMLTSDGVVKILDFGLAKNIAATSGSPTRESDPGTIVGTYGYMSPEQARAGAVDYRSDQFALGAILYEMLTGTAAFAGASGVETLFMVVRDEPPSLTTAAPYVPTPLRWIVERCLAKDPDDRYTATRDLARDLQHLRDHFSEAGATTPLRDETVSARRNVRWPLLALLAIAALLLGAGVMAWVRRPVPRTITSEHFLTYSGNDFSPAVSPDGKLIAFSSRRDGVQRIWLKQIAGGNEVALTAGPDDFPRFSPDGTSILYAHVVPGHAALFRIPVVGGEARKLVEGSISGDFSPDGSKIAFTRLAVSQLLANRSSLCVANADGSGERQLLQVDLNGLLHPRWSPDQKSVAAVGARGRVTQFVLIADVASGKSQLLPSLPKSGEISSVIWTADGKSVIYARAESIDAVVGSSAQIIRQDIAGGRMEVIGWSSHSAITIDPLASGSIIMDSRSPRDNLRETAIGDATHERWLTRGNSSDRQPVYSPDGKSLLFSSNRSGNLDLWSLEVATGAVRRVTDDAAEDWDPAFTADGKKIVWSSGRSGSLEIWMANADGSGAHQVSHDGTDAENPSVTPDGQWVIYNSFDHAKAGIWRVHPDGTGATPIFTGVASLPDLSPDGRYVAYLANGRTVRAAIRFVRVADGADSGSAIPIATARRTSAILGRCRWMPDGKSVAFLAQDPGGVNGIFVQEFSPGQDTSATKRALGGFDRESATESFGISPDGKTLTVAGWEQLFSLFSIEGLPDITARRGDKREN